MRHVTWLSVIALLTACGSGGGEASRHIPGMAGEGGVAGQGGVAGSGGLGGTGSSAGGASGEAGGGLASGGAGAGGVFAGAGGEAGAPLEQQGRGLYVSPYTDHIGQVTFAGDDLAYAQVLGDSAKERALLDFIAAEQFDSIALYNLNAILPDEALSDALVEFMASARQAGVRRIEAIGAEGTAPWDAIFAFHEGRARFDGLVTEIEFWGGSVSFADFVGTLEYVRSLGWSEAESGQAPTLSAYVGWFDAEQAEQMAPLLDRVYTHVYVDSAADSYAYGAERFQLLAAANEQLGTSVQVWPIFSAEDTEYAAGSEHFMGEWLQVNGVAAAEAEFVADWQAAGMSEQIELGGYQYYEYFFLDKYLP